MTYKNSLIIILILITIYSCDKNEINPPKKMVALRNVIEVNTQDTVFKVSFTDSKVTSFEYPHDKYLITYDGDKVNYVTNVYNEKDSDIDSDKYFYYYSNSTIDSVIRVLDRDNSTSKYSYFYKYKNSKLDAIIIRYSSYLPERYNYYDFFYNGENVSKISVYYGRNEPTGEIWRERLFEYDDSSNIYSSLKDFLPIFLEYDRVKCPISNNNVNNFSESINGGETYFNLTRRYSYNEANLPYFYSSIIENLALPVTFDYAVEYYK